MATKGMMEGTPNCRPASPPPCAIASTPIHTGEQIYLRQNFVELIADEQVAVILRQPGLVHEAELRVARG